MRKQEVHIFKGMQQDLDIAKHGADFLRDAHNIRLVQEDGSNTLVITNEKSTEELSIVGEENESFSINGKCLGYCVIDDYIVLFTKTSSTDYIYVLEFKGGHTFEGSIKFEGTLHLDESYPVEAVGIYESDSIIKVYWVDGKNEARFINIKGEKLTEAADVSFVKDIQLNEKVNITTLYEGTGVFPAGVLQYAFSYFNKNSVQSAIFYTTPLYSIVNTDKGASPEDSVSCAFQINVQDLDPSFKYLRIYSIQRTSLNAIPSVKYIDVPIIEGEVSYTDFNIEGSSMDPAELLYIGGQHIIPNNICIKDNTLFLGGYTETNPVDYSKMRNYPSTGSTVTSETRQVRTKNSSIDDYYTKVPVTSSYSGGFKAREDYELGFQVQDSSGKWLDPVSLGHHTQANSPVAPDDKTSPYTVPSFSITLDKNTLEGFLNTAGVKNAKRVRAVMVAPSWNTRKILAQCVICPTIKNTSALGAKYQSSWFFRSIVHEYHPTREKDILDIEDCYPTGIDADHIDDRDIDSYAELKSSYYFCKGQIPEWRDGAELPYPADFNKEERPLEAYASFVPENAEMPFSTGFKVDWQVLTLHSPEFEFLDDVFANLDLAGTTIKTVGRAAPVASRGLMDVTTSSAAASSDGGFTLFYNNVAKGENPVGEYRLPARSLFSGPFYKDAPMDDWEGGYHPAPGFPGEVHPLFNNSNWYFFLYAWHPSRSLNNDVNRESRLALLSRKKIANFKTFVTYYYTNFDSSIDINNFGYKFVNFAEARAVSLGDSGESYLSNVDSLIAPENYEEGKYPLYAYFDVEDPRFKIHGAVSIKRAVGKAALPEWPYEDENLQNGTESIRIKYKSSPHLVVRAESSMGRKYANLYNSDSMEAFLPIVEVTRGEVPTIQDSNKQWIPVGEPVLIAENGNTTIKAIYGDTWYTRYDCLKTYPFSLEDENCIVEVGSFFLETRVNLDGRYDNHIGDFSLVTTPEIFNLYNKVYSQSDNFFSYRLTDELYIPESYHPNTVVWSKEKQLGELIDSFTSISPSSFYDIDGKLGRITSLVTDTNYLYAFQEKGVSQLLFNSRVQIPVSDGAPIEITNNNKMDGYRVLSTNHGLTHKWSLVKGLPGYYFINSLDRDLYLFAGNAFNNVGSQKGMGSWIKQNNYSEYSSGQGGKQRKIKDDTKEGYDLQLLRLFYDNNTHDLYLSNGVEFLDFSESIGQFTSFLDYSNVDGFIDFPQNSLAITQSGGVSKIYRLFSDTGYNTLLDNDVYPSLTFVSNSDPTLDKTFTNLDIRGDFYDEDGLSSDKFFSHIRAWDEYQDTGVSELSYEKYKHSSLKKKFRIWHIDIPRDHTHKLDRIRNTWAAISLRWHYPETTEHFELHDIGVTYYI